MPILDGYEACKKILNFYQKFTENDNSITEKKDLKCIKDLSKIFNLMKNKDPF